MGYNEKIQLFKMCNTIAVFETDIYKLWNRTSERNTLNMLSLQKFSERQFGRKELISIYSLSS